MLTSRFPFLSPYCPGLDKNGPSALHPHEDRTRKDIFLRKFKLKLLHARSVVLRNVPALYGEFGDRDALVSVCK